MTAGSGPVIGPDLVELCDRLVELVGDRAETIATARRGPSSLTRFATSFIHQNVEDDSTEVHLLAVVDGRAASVSGNQTSPEALDGLVERALTAARLRPVDPDWPGLAPPAAAPDVAHWDEATHAATPADRAEVVRGFVAAGDGLEAAGYCSTESVERALATSSGQRLSGRATSAALSGIHRTAASDGSAEQSSVRLGDLDGAKAGTLAAAKARAAEHAEDIEPGQYEVVLEPRCLANMLLFVTAYGFNAKAVADGTSFVHLGEQQFDASFDLWDDVTDPRAVGIGYDPEGTPKQRVDLVRGGVTTGIVHDRRTATKAGTESTGHATGMAAFGPYPSNVFVGEGTGPAEDLVANVERGLLVSDFWYTRILDPKTQVVTGLTRNGVFRIQEGKVVGAVRNLRFTQSFVAALGPGKIKGIAADARLVEGRHVPTVHLASWSFTGGAKG